MRSATDLRDSIIREANELFIQQGYAATTIKQIASGAGCTTAALYYYFAGGKAEILREVVRTYADVLTHIFEHTTNATTLPEFVQRLGDILARTAPDVLRRMSWILADFPKLHPNEQHQLHALLLTIHAHIAHEIHQFVADEVQAQRLAWFVFCAYFGYEQVFLTLDTKRIVPLSYEEFAQTLASIFAAR